ncbi:serine acetyltransferase [Williamsia limnetica]
MGKPTRIRPISYPLVFAYRVLTEFFLGIELRPKTRIGPGLSIYHGYGLVVNDHCVLGKNVVLRNGVTIGHRIAGGGVPTIGDSVEVGAGAIVLGEISIGDGARIGAGSVVLASVNANCAVAGNPARAINTMKADTHAVASSVTNKNDVGGSHTPLADARSVQRVDDTHE